jgi:hypothetical protein
MNATVFQDFRRIWRVTTVQRGERTMMMMGWLALAGGTLAAFGAFLAILAGKQDALFLVRMLAGFGACWLGVVWMALFVPASILLNSPANARLVPRQCRRLMQMAAGTWFLIAAGMSFASGEWAVFPAVGLPLIGFALMRAGRSGAGLLFILGLNWSTLSRHVLPRTVVEAIGSDAGMWTLTALLLPMGAWALRVLYPAAGDRHLAGRDAQVKRVGQQNQHGAEDTGLAGRLRQWTTAHVYGAMLQRDLRRPRPGKLLMHALGPVAHWSAWSGSVASALALGLGVRLLLVWRGEGRVLHSLGGGLGVGLTAAVIMVVFSTAVFSQQIRKTAGEQALLRLTPLAGQAALLNQRLARELLKGALCNWLMLTVAIVLATVLIGGDLALVLRLAALCVLAGQVAMAGLLDDYAGEGGWSPSLALGVGLVALVELLVALLLQKLSGVSIWAWVALIAIGAGAWQLRRSWRAMLASKPAFPAGRF